jgi:ArsR family transcriptional regulator, arsenate/arsenite/antimonite-responsive transcriptional repressor
MNADAVAAVAKALAHPVRVRIVELLASEPECRGADVFSRLPLAQSTVSQHLAILRESGAIVVHPVGQSNVYCIAPDVLSSFAADIAALATAVPQCPGESRTCS